MLKHIFGTVGLIVVLAGPAAADYWAVRESWDADFARFGALVAQIAADTRDDYTDLSARQQAELLLIKSAAPAAFQVQNLDDVAHFSQNSDYFMFTFFLAEMGWPDDAHIFVDTHQTEIAGFIKDQELDTSLAELIENIAYTAEGTDVFGDEFARPDFNKACASLEGGAPLDGDVESRFDNPAFLPVCRENWSDIDPLSDAIVTGIETLWRAEAEWLITSVVDNLSTDQNYDLLRDVAAKIAADPEADGTVQGGLLYLSAAMLWALGRGD